MCPLRYKSTILALAALLILAPRINGEDRSDGERTKRIEYMIELLASKNPAPKISGNARLGEDQTITFPEDYDRSLQVPVYLALKELLAEDEAAMDLLLAHEGDDRYSFSVNADKDENITVSEACEWIAEQKLRAFEHELHVITRSQFGLYPEDVTEPFKVWWSNNRQRGLLALQVDAIDAAIKFMTTVDRATALPWHPDAELLPLEEFNRHRDTNLRTLKAIRQYVVTTDAPYRAKTLVDAHSYLFGLPWTGRRHNK